MKNVHMGKSDSKTEIVIYNLDDAKDILRIVNESKKIVPSYDFADMDNSYMRFCIVKEELYAIAGIMEDEFVNTPKKELPTYYADEIEEVFKDKLKGYDLVETKEGFLAIVLDGYLDDNEKLKELFSKYMSANEDFNMVLGESMHMCWMPSVVDGLYVLKPVCCPTFGSDWCLKTLQGSIIRLF